ncbi:MAG TPA: c-type cytochrome [Casimicrobiaceae bacterium]|nr:c-type cytochrome [Casimicrobiaceae bacterium]
MFALAIVSVADAAPRFGFGKPASKEEIAGWNIDVRPDGTGLPAGRGSVAQGQVIYDAQCASCHGTFGESNDYMAIAGGIGSLATNQPMRTTGSKLNFATTLWDYINRAMPFQNPKSLKPDEVYALTAYVLNLNDILPAEAALDQVSILAVRMPNRDGFTSAHGLASRTGTPDTKNVACMRDCASPPKLSSEIPDYARDAHGSLADQMRDLRSQRPTAIIASATPRDPAELAKSSGCLACHGVSNRIVGPGLQEIRARYAKDSGAEARLAARVKQGSTGTWGSVPMPANPQLNDGDIRSLIRWILAGTP